MNATACKKRDEGPCRLCGTMENLTGHHIVPELWFRMTPRMSGRRHTEANIVPLCKHCHRLIDGQLPKTAAAMRVRRMQARSRLRQELRMSEVGFVLDVRGEKWLNHHYPLSVPHHDVKRDGTKLVFI